MTSLSQSISGALLWEETIAEPDSTSSLLKLSDAGHLAITALDRRSAIRRAYLLVLGGGGLSLL